MFNYKKLSGKEMEFIRTFLLHVHITQSKCHVVSMYIQGSANINNCIEYEKLIFYTHIYSNFLYTITYICLYT